MKHTIAVFLTIYALWLAAMPALAQTIKLGTLAPEGSPWYNAFRDIAEAWKTASGGTIHFRIYAGGVAGDDPDMVRKMRIGQLHAAALTGAGLAEIAPEIQALQMPMMFDSYAELDYVRERLAPQLEAIFAAKGFKVLNWGEAGWVQFFAHRPVMRPEDLKPLKLFTWAGDTTYVEAWKDAGYHPVPLPATEIHTALQSGLINAFSTTPLAALSFQWFGLAKHMTDLKWAPLVGAMVMTMPKWRELPEAMQPDLLQIAREVGARLQGEGRKLNEEAIAVMQKHGLVVHPVSPEAVAYWERSARAAYPKLLGKVVPAVMVAEVERLRNEYRATRQGR
jgi:TRAP-type C4-dicarboxylate transport system substrate-binding protein